MISRKLGILTGLTLLGLSARVQAQPIDLEPETQLAIEALEHVRAWRIDEAEPIVRRLYAEAPENPLTEALVAQVKLHRGDYGGAVEYFEAAKEGGAPPVFLMDAEAAAQAAVATEGYAEHVGEHFIIRYPPGKDGLLVPFAEEALDEALEKIGALLGWRPTGKVVLELYPTAKTLAAVSALTPEDIETSGTIALCRWSRLMATTPRAVVFGYAWRDTLAHELTHLLIGGASKNTVPIWLHEGLAKFAETAWREKPGLGISVKQQDSLREAAKKDELIPFADMHPSMAKLPSQEAASLAFAEVFTFIEYLVEQKGWPGIRQLLRTMAQGKSDAEAIEVVYGATLEAMERRWKATLPKRPIQRLSGLHVVKGERPIVVKDRADTPDDELHGLDDVARRHARAADLLFARSRFIAAQRELERAFARSGSPLVSAKLATLSLANGDLDRAEEAATRSIEAMPELAGPNVTLAEILLRRGKKEAMAAPLSRAIDINPFDPRIHELTIAAGTDRNAVANAQAALRLREQSSAANPDDRGHGARIRVEGLPFSRVYLKRQGSTYPTRMVTPTSTIELRPGEWTLEWVPSTGEPVRRTVRISESEDIRAIEAPRG